jgi:hypothetical protein
MRYCICSPYCWLYVWFEHPGHTYGGFVPSFSERGMTDRLSAFHALTSLKRTENAHILSKLKRFGHLAVPTYTWQEMIKVVIGFLARPPARSDWCRRPGDWLPLVVGLVEPMQNGLASQARSERSSWTSLRSQATPMQRRHVRLHMHM